MTQDPTADRLAFARRMIREAGQVALAHFNRRDSLEIITKSDGQDLVTAADKGVETFIRQAIAADYPDDGIIGEEHGADFGQSGFTWILDPIDGTSVFLHGLQSWSVVISLYQGENVVAGLILQPSNDTLYYASAGQGGFVARGDEVVPMRVSQIPFTSSFIAVGTGDAQKMGQFLTNVLNKGGVHIRNGSSALTLAHVAAGNYGGFYEGLLYIWDMAGGMLMVREAGGVTSPLPLLSDYDKRVPCYAASALCDAPLQDCIVR